MALFRRKNKGVLDLTEKYRRDQERATEMRADSADSTSESSNAFGFLGNMATASTSGSEDSDNYPTLGGDAGERRRELSKKLLQLTEKIEDISNQIYHLQQRIEVLERKVGVGAY